jgi:peptidoglycan/LPS O-acetylase OafA/YrhL
VAYFATAAVLVSAFAEITARWVETPLRRKGHARAQPWLARRGSQPDQILHA